MADGDDYVAPLPLVPREQKLRAGILGVSGAAGQQFLAALQDHPQFEVTRVYGQSSAGKMISEIRRYVDIDATMYRHKIEVPSLAHIDELDLVFSALPSEPARELEAMFAKEIPVISVSSAYRYEQDVPILIPEVNAQHAQLIDWQMHKRGWKGFIVPGPNCTTVPAAITLAALKKYEPKKVVLTSEQAVSGAGIEALDDFLLQEVRQILHSMPPTLTKTEKDSLGELLLKAYPGVKEVKDGQQYEHNIIPYIKGEEEKVSRELKKILGEFTSEINPYPLVVNSTCTRVPIPTGHTLVMTVETADIITPESAEEAFEIFNAQCKAEFGGLHSSPERTITVMQEEDRPQPAALDAELDGGMTTCIGRIRPLEGAQGIQYAALSNNLKKGAAKGAVQTAEFLVREGYIQ